MEQEKLYLSSNAVSLSDADDKPYLEMTNRLCWYDAPNLNGVMLPSDTADEFAHTLIDMPVQAKYKVGKDGKSPDLGGHEAYLDKDGDVCFATESIGVHTSVEVKDDEVEIGGVKKTLPCLFATSRIWKRNKNIIKAIHSLFERGLLTSSWEIASKEYQFSDGIKTLTNYEFLGNALLGSAVKPAYSCATPLSLSVLGNSEMELAEALALDIKEENKLANKKDTTAVEEEIATLENASTETEETKNLSDAQEDNIANSHDETDTSSLTEWDLRQRISEACRKTMDGKWCWVSFWFPAENTVWCEYEGRKSELDYLMFTYTIDKDEVNVSEPIPVTLTVSVLEMNEVISQKDNALLKANETITNLKAQINALEPFKEAADKAEFEKMEAEKAEKRSNLKAYALKSGFISEDEITNSEDNTAFNAELAEMIEELNESGIKSVIATRFMDSLNKDSVETSEVKELKVGKVSIDLNNEDEDEKVSINPVQAYLN